MADVLMTNASVMTVGTASYAIQNFVIHDATNMANARMELVYVSLVGMESTAHLKVVLEGKTINLL